MMFARVFDTRHTYEQLSAHVRLESDLTGGEKSLQKVVRSAVGRQEEKTAVLGCLEAHGDVVGVRLERRTQSEACQLVPGVRYHRSF